VGRQAQEIPVKTLAKKLQNGILRAGSSVDFLRGGFSAAFFVSGGPLRSLRDRRSVNFNP
jgi:hypothetical protein